MTYDLSNGLHYHQFCDRADKLKERGAVVELREVTGRTKAQNKYLHLILGVVAIETGNTLAYTKDMYFKRLVNPGIFALRKEDTFLGPVVTLRSSKDLTTEEMSEAIDRFKRWAAEQGIYIPEPEDEERLRDIELEMGRMKSYL